MNKFLFGALLSVLLVSASFAQADSETTDLGSKLISLVPVGAHNTDKCAVVIESKKDALQISVSDLTLKGNLAVNLLFNGQDQNLDGSYTDETAQLKITTKNSAGKDVAVLVDNSDAAQIGVYLIVDQKASRCILDKAAL